MNTSFDSLRELIERNIHDLHAENSDLQRESLSLRKELNELKQGLHGACYACEPVGKLNAELLYVAKELYTALEYFTDFHFMEDEDGYSQERGAVHSYRNLITKLSHEYKN